jgi:hypothetical protein
MANHLGNEGQIKVGTNTVAEVRSFSITESVDLVEDTTMGDAAKTFQPTQTFWEASVEVFWDETDTNGQQAMTVGSSITFNGYPEGSSSGDTYFTGAAIVESRDVKGTHNGLVEASLKLRGNGALSKTTV